MRIILSGGGTGGHIYPALAIASEIKSRVPTAELLYIGTGHGLESKIVPAAGLKFRTIDIRGIDRSSMLKAGKSLAKIPASFFQARDIVKTFKPDVIIGTGGYVSFPIVLAGTFFDVRTFIHEQNAMPGLANRNLAKRVDCVLLTFEEAAKHLNAKRIRLTGLPVRKEILAMQGMKSAADPSKKRFTILAFGGSQGAMSINNAMLGLVERYKDDPVKIIWITGHNTFDNLKDELSKRINVSALKCQLEILPYMNNIEAAMLDADLAVCRAGASTLCELEVLGLPAILIPYPYAADNHQEKNARALVEKNAAEMVIDEYLDGDTLYKGIEKLRNDRDKLKAMGKNMLREARPNALNEIVDEVLSK